MQIALDTKELAEALVQALRHPDVRQALGIGTESQTAAEPRYTSLEGYAKRLAVSERTIRKWCARGLPTIKMGSVVRVVVAKADEWLEGGGNVRRAVLCSLKEIRLERALGQAIETRVSVAPQTR